MTEEQFRAVALAFDGAVEGAHMAHPDFRANGRVFASLHSNGATGMVKLTPDQQAVFVREHAAMFAPASGAWGRQGYTKVTLAAVTRPALRSAMLLAFQGVMALPAPRAAAKRRPATKR